MYGTPFAGTRFFRFILISFAGLFFVHSSYIPISSLNLGTGGEGIDDCAKGIDVIVCVYTKGRKIKRVKTDLNGNKIGTVSNVHSYTGGRDARDAAIAYNADNEIFLVAWSDGQDNNGAADEDMDIKARRLGVAGNPFGGVTTVRNSDTSKTRTSVAATKDRFIVVWYNLRVTGSGDFDIGLTSRKIGVDGVPIGDRVTIESSETYKNIGSPFVVGHPNGAMLIYEYYTDGNYDNRQSKAQRFDSNLNKIGAPFNIYGNGGYRDPAKHRWLNGRYLGVYRRAGRYRYRFFRTDGSTIGSEKNFPDGFGSYQTALGYNGSNYFVVSGNDFVRINKSNSNLLDSAKTFSPSISYDSYMHWTGKFYLVYNSDKVYRFRLDDNRIPEVDSITKIYDAGTNYYNLDEISRIRYDAKNLVRIDALDNDTGNYNNWGMHRIWACFDYDKRTTNASFLKDGAADNDFCLRQVMLYNDNSFPYTKSLNNYNIKSVSSPDSIPLYYPFHLDDGWNYLNIRLLDADKKFGGGNNNGYGALNLGFDQYAPCDHKDHLCDIFIRDGNGNSKDITTSSTPTAVINDLDFDANFVIQEISGSNIYTNGNHTNIRILLAKHQGTEFLAGGNTLDRMNAAVKDSKCDFGGETDFSGNVIRKAGLFEAGAGIWKDNAGGVLEYRFINNAGSQSMTISSNDTAHGSSTTLKSSIIDLLGNCSGTPCDGTVFMFVCAKDKAGNWTTIIKHNQNGMYLNATTRPGYRGFNQPFRLGAYSPTAENNDVSKIQAFVPPFHKRIFYDGPAPEASCTESNSDPCAIQKLAFDENDYKLTSETDVYIAYYPPDFTSATTITAGVKLPEDSSGIAGLYYKIGNKPDTPTDGVYVPADDFIPCNNVDSAYGETPGSGTFVDACFNFAAFGSEFLYVWLKDNAGNIGWGSPNGAATRPRKIFVDAVKPSAPGAPQLKTTPIVDAKPYFEWLNSSDSGGIGKYILCLWPENPLFTQDALISLDGECPSGAYVGALPEEVQSLFVAPNPGTQTEYQFTESLGLGRYSVSIIGYDNAGNPSLHSNMMSFPISDQRPRLDFTYENDDYSLGAVSPVHGTSGDYTFVVRYTELENRKPIYSQLWVDLNGNDEYDADEKFNMSAQTDTAIQNGEDDSEFSGKIDIDGMSQEELRAYRKYQAQNGALYDGEDFQLTLELKFLRKTNGRLKYRFHFASDLNQAIDGDLEGNPVGDNYIQLDPYDLETFDGMMQVRNNYVRPGKKNPVILLKPPAQTSRKVSLSIYTVNGRLVKHVVRNKPYNRIDRYRTWDLRTKNGRRVKNGIYLAIYNYGGRTISKRYIIVMR